MLCCWALLATAAQGQANCRDECLDGCHGFAIICRLSCSSACLGQVGIATMDTTEEPHKDPEPSPQQAAASHSVDI
ncbi:hypothetical protein ABZP36_017954 [Zizania latifolia]